jgi:hypothetical protein
MARSEAEPGDTRGSLAAKPGLAPAAPACPSSQAAIERLVREDLGCTCPAEVFNCIEDRLLVLPGLADPARRFAIGGRLLVYLIAVTDAAQARAQLPLWLTAGRAERDAAAMNRLRLVLITAEPEAICHALQSAFAALPERDERTHLHVLSRAAVAGL